MTARSLTPSRGRRIAGMARAERLPWARGVSNWKVAHFGYIELQRSGRTFSHHTLVGGPGRKPGAWTCGICGRWVIRGMGRWWETWPTR